MYNVLKYVVLMVSDPGTEKAAPLVQKKRGKRWGETTEPQETVRFWDHLHQNCCNGPFESGSPNFESTGKLLK